MSWLTLMDLTLIQLLRSSADCLTYHGRKPLSIVIISNLTLTSAQTRHMVLSLERVLQLINIGMLTAEQVKQPPSNQPLDAKHIDSITENSLVVTLGFGAKNEMFDLPLNNIKLN